MDIGSVFIVFYVATSIFAIAMTYREQKRRGHSTPVFALIGYLLCTVWPLLVAAILVFTSLSPKPGEHSSERS